MQIDMHYYCIYYLCLAAGFQPKDAYIIAYSSQYVDDAKEYETIQLKDKTGNVKFFDPICTQHMSLKSFGQIISDKIYLPFHFVPTDIGNASDERILTKVFEENKIHQKIFKDALKSNNLYRLGIALHAMADSYSHQNFSGDWSTVNQVSLMRCVLRERVVPSNLLDSIGWLTNHYVQRLIHWIFSVFAPVIGHLRAHKIPDYPHAVWRYRNYQGISVKMSNPDQYIRCAMTIFKWLKRIQKKYPVRLGEPEVKATVKEAIYQTGPVEKRIGIWEKSIKQTLHPEVIPYHELDWKKKAFSDSENMLWNMAPRTGKQYQIQGTFSDFKKSHFFRFHLAAQKHRINVLQALKGVMHRFNLSLQETRQKVILS
ncbi:hypothetical protein BVY01_02955 [bacterium I07]|nr:hypothetical protein BVY01_02955 [bacterium I07]